MIYNLSAIFFSSFLIALSGALMPGPFLTVTVSESSRRGIITGPLLILGHGILELAHLLALLAGMAPFFKRDSVFVFIALVGGVILFWMAVSMFRNLSALSLNIDGDPGKTKNLIVAGIIFSLVNPYWTIWWASIGLGYIMTSAKYGIPGITAFFVGHILADLAWYTFVSFSVAKGRSFLNDTLYRRLIGGCASFLLAFACYFFYSGLEKII